MYKSISEDVGTYKGLGNLRSLAITEDVGLRD